MKKFLLTTALFLIIATALSPTARGQGYVAAASVKAQTTNTAAYFDSTGTLSATPNVCTGCPIPTGTFAKTVTLNSTQLKNLHSVPDTLLPAPGRNLTYNVTGAYASIQYNSVAYATDSVLNMYFNTGGVIGQNTDVTYETKNYTSNFLIGTADDQNYPSNQPLLLTTATANMTAGNSVITVTVYYTFLPVPF